MKDRSIHLKCKGISRELGIKYNGMRLLVEVGWHGNDGTTRNDGDRDTR